MIKEEHLGAISSCIWIIVTIIGEIVIFFTVPILVLKIVAMIICPILVFLLSLAIGIYISKHFVEPDEDKETDNSSNENTEKVTPTTSNTSYSYKKNNNYSMTLDYIVLYAQKLLSNYGNQEFLNMLCSKGFQFIDTNEVLKQYFFGEIKLRKLNKIEFAKVLQFCGLTYYCFKHFIWLEEKDITQIYTKEQLIEKINKLAYDSLYLKMEIIDPLQIISPKMNWDILYSASKQPDLIKYITVNMIDQGMTQVIPDKEKIMDIIMINHIFINILAGDN